MTIKSVETYKKALEYLSKRGALVGIDLLAPNYKPFTLRSFVLVFDAITYTMVTIYCIFEFFSELEKLVFCLVTYGFATQGFSKLQTFWVKRHNLYKFNDLIIEFHRSASSPAQTKIYEKYSVYFVWACKICNFLYSFVGIVTISNPIVIKLWTGNLVLPYGFKLPMIDETSFFGYIINFCHHLLQDFLVVSGFIYSDSLYAIIVLQVNCVFDVIIQMLDELNEMIGQKGLPDKAIKKKLVSIIQLHQRLLSYTSFVEDVFKTNLLIVIFSDVSQIVCCLFALVISKWVIGAFLLVLLTFQILIMCTFGTVIKIKNEALRQKLYDINWNRMDVNDQKLLQIILITANQDVQFTYGLGVLDFESFVTIYQKIYSVLMMLFNFY